MLDLRAAKVARQCHGKFDQKQYGKRVGTQLERETPQVKKSRLTTSKVEPFKIKKDGLISPAVIVHDESASSRKIKSPDEGQLDVLPKQGVGVLSGVNPVELAVISKAQPKFRAQDITKEEAAFELQQCVLLLQKYGVLNTREYYLSQSFPSCAPHPGFAGDKHLSKRCKICRVLEDSNSTVICDECQESFHLSCCLPRLNPKHFDREDDWYCSSCKKQKRRMGRFYDIGRADGRGGPAGMSFISKVKLGTAYQANVPLWTGSADDGSLGKSSNEALFGMEEPLAEEAKENEKRRLLNEFELKAEKWRKQLANSTCVGTPENWLQCRSVVVKPFKDFDGNKHSETVCGKWRRAPSNIQQFERWECFCAIEWDPCHADCAVPQELPTEEILRRMQVKKDLQPSEDSFNV
ncbi:hypothetical protein L7F22_063721 [Adiantum nelumboides]|nr:hypothetical protein [Adiantum nelumboides]